MKYIWQTVTGKITLKPAAILPLQGRRQYANLETIDEILTFASNELEAEGTQLLEVANSLKYSSAVLRDWLRAKYDWIDSDKIQTLGEEMLEEAALLRQFVKMYREGDPRALVPASLSIYDNRPKPEKRPVGRPPKAPVRPAIFDTLPDDDEELRRMIENPVKPKLKWD